MKRQKEILVNLYSINTEDTLNNEYRYLENVFQLHRIPPSQTHFGTADRPALQKCKKRIFSAKLKMISFGLKSNIINSQFLLSFFSLLNKMEIRKQIFY